MNQLQTVQTLPETTRDLIMKLAHQAPGLSDLTPEQAQAVAQAFLGEQLKAELGRAVLAERVNLDEETGRFLEDQRSIHTRRAYASALSGFRTWLKVQHLQAAGLTPAQADDYIRELKAEGKDDDTARLRIAALSSFYTFLERRYAEIRNPFRGTKIRPRSSWATAVIPSPKELETIQEKADPLLKAVLAVILETGLRIGALPELRVKADGSFYTLTKGKRFEGFESLSRETRELLASAGLSGSRPFDPEALNGRGGAKDPASRMAASLTTRLVRHCEALKAAGALGAVYSPHDFRHAFAEAHAGEGLVWLRDRLGHASIAVTEHYLKNTLGRNTSGV